MKSSRLLRKDNNKKKLRNTNLEYFFSYLRYDLEFEALDSRIQNSGFR